MGTGAPVVQTGGCQATTTHIRLCVCSLEWEGLQLQVLEEENTEPHVPQLCSQDRGWPFS